MDEALMKLVRKGRDICSSEDGDHDVAPLGLCEAMADAIEGLAAEVEGLRETRVSAIAEDAKLLSMDYTGPNGEFEARVASPLAGVLAEWVARDFDAAGAENFVVQPFSLAVRHRETRREFNITIQLATGETPEEKWSEAKREVARLEAMLVPYLVMEVESAGVMMGGWFEHARGRLGWSAELEAAINELDRMGRIERHPTSSSLVRIVKVGGE